MDQSQRQPCLSVVPSFHQCVGDRNFKESSNMSICILIIIEYCIAVFTYHQCSELLCLKMFDSEARIS